MEERGEAQAPDRILIVDDDLTTRKALERSLERVGYQVTSAEDGESGLAIALKLEPTVIVSDLRMARLDGHTLLRRVTDHGLDAAVVIVSAQGELKDVIDVLRNGAVDFLEKPWKQAELLGAVARAAEIHDHRRSTRQLRASLDQRSSSQVQVAREAGVPDAERAIGPVILPCVLPDLVRDLEDRYINAALQKTDGNKAAAAQLLGLGRTTLTERLRRHGTGGKP
jgi:DNA-binding NtrC family response regulator